MVSHFLELNNIENECTHLMIYAKKGIRIKGKPKDLEGIWALYKKRYGDTISTFCSEELIGMGYAQSVRYRHSPDTEEVNLNTVYDKYTYIVNGCTLTVTMKSNKRVVIETCFGDTDENFHEQHQFTLSYTD